MGRCGWLQSIVFCGLVHSRAPKNANPLTTSSSHGHYPALAVSPLPYGRCIVLPKSRIAHGIVTALLVSLLPWRAPCAELTVQVRDRLNAPVAFAAVLAEPLDPPTSGRKTTVDSGVTMKQNDRRFVPHALIVAPGTAVQLPNVDTVRHHVYSLSPAKRFELRLYSGMPPQPVVFDTPGIVVLGCNIHDWMAAFVYVTAAPYH